MDTAISLETVLAASSHHNVSKAPDTDFCWIRLSSAQVGLNTTISSARLNGFKI